jgi:DNA-binding MurR/RpiR family transcriptional regulator
MVLTSKKPDSLYFTGLTRFAASVIPFIIMDNFIERRETPRIISYMLAHCAKLKGSSKKVAEYVAAVPGKVINQTSMELAADIDVSEASVVRFCQKLGFKGFREFKIRLAQDLGTDSPVPIGINQGDSVWDVVQKVMNIEYEDIKFTSDMLDRAKVEEAISILRNAEKIAFFGVGSSSLVAKNAKEHFLYYGKSAHAESEGLAQIVLANTLGKNDAAFAISISGQSQIPIKAVTIAAKNGAKTICLTHNAQSPLAKVSDCVLLGFRKDKSMDDLGITTRIVLTVIIDALSVAYASQEWDKVSYIARENRTNFKPYQFGHEN